MEDFPVMFWPFSIPIVAIIGAFVFAIIQTLARARVRELEVRERIAMIERGLVPPPEVDPRGFDRAMDRYDRYRHHTPGRHRRAGVTLMGVGFGLMLLITFAGENPSAGFGVGGFLVIMGVAFFINSLFDHRYEPPASPRPYGPPNSTFGGQVPPFGAHNPAPGPTVDAPRRD
jgi:hypothetical protein